MHCCLISLATRVVLGLNRDARNTQAYQIAAKLESARLSY